MRLANMMNGLAYPPYDGISYFQIGKIKTSLNYEELTQVSKYETQ